VSALSAVSQPVWKAVILLGSLGGYYSTTTEFIVPESFKKKKGDDSISLEHAVSVFELCFSFQNNIVPF
jgi:hypothetical protein